MGLGLPIINLVFKTKASTAIERSARGIVACILKDDTEGGKEVTVYKSISEVDFTEYTEKNYKFLKLIYEGRPNKVIVLRQRTEVQGYAQAFQKLENLNWNYLTIPELGQADVSTVSAWIKEQREQKKKTFKAVLPECRADHEGIINFTTDQVESTITENVHTATEYCSRIAGILAGLSLERSSTYYVLNDVISAQTPVDPNERIDAGELVVIFDGEKYKIGRGVNSLTTFTAEKGEDIRKIKIVEGMDLYLDDIRSTFEDSYVGKVVNDYDNKQAFVAAVNSYHKGLLGNVLDRNYENAVSVDLNAQRRYLEERGIDISGMKETEVAMANTGSKVFLSSNVKFVDAMEDLSMNVSM